MFHIPGNIAVGLKKDRVGDGTSSVPILQNIDLTNLDVGLAVEKLFTGYSGNCIEVYRVSDGATQDIGFNSSNILDTEAIETFLGSSDGKVRTWYDQSGTGKHYRQTDNTLMPDIATGGTVLLNPTNSLPEIVFDGTQYLSSLSAHDLSGFVLSAYMSLRYLDLVQRIWGSEDSTSINHWPLIRNNGATTNHRMFFLLTANATGGRALSRALPQDGTLNNGQFFAFWVDQSTQDADTHDSISGLVQRAAFSIVDTDPRINSIYTLGTAGNQWFNGSMQNFYLFIGENNETSSGQIIINRLSKNY